MQKQRITDRQQKILKYLSDNFVQGYIDTEMINSFVVKVTDRENETLYFSIDENDVITSSDHLSMEDLVYDMQEYVFDHMDKVAEPQALNDRQTVVISAYGGPGSGKTVACMDICQQLKKRGYNAEYVSEVAKDYVYEEDYNMLDGSAEHQYEILQEQLKRVDRLLGKTDFVVTDSPVLLNGIYNQQLTPEYQRLLLMLHEQYNNFVFFVKRDASQYQQEGRLQDLAESMKKDEEILSLLDENQIYYGTYYHKTVGKIVDNSIRTFDRIQSGYLNEQVKQYVFEHYWNQEVIDIQSLGNRQFQLTDQEGGKVTISIQQGKVKVLDGVEKNLFQEMMEDMQLGTQVEQAMVMKQ